MAQFQYVNILLFIVVGVTLFVSSWSYTKYYPRLLVSHKKKSQLCVVACSLGAEKVGEAQTQPTLYKTK